MGMHRLNATKSVSDKMKQLEGVIPTHLVPYVPDRVFGTNPHENTFIDGVLPPNSSEASSNTAKTTGAITKK